jgi:hypothetical protein
VIAFLSGGSGCSGGWGAFDVTASALQQEARLAALQTIAIDPEREKRQD